QRARRRWIPRGASNAKVNSGDRLADEWKTAIAGNTPSGRRLMSPRSRTFDVAKWFEGGDERAPVMFDRRGAPRKAQCAALAPRRELHRAEDVTARIALRRA